MTTYIGEWLTLDQAARALGIPRAELRPLHIAGDIVTEQIRPGVWRVRTSSVDDLLATPEWKARAASQTFSNAEEAGPGWEATGPAPAAEFSGGGS